MAKSKRVQRTTRKPVNSRSESTEIDSEKEPAGSDDVVGAEAAEGLETDEAGAEADAKTASELSESDDDADGDDAASEKKASKDKAKKSGRAKKGTGRSAEKSAATRTSRSGNPAKRASGRKTATYTGSNANSVRPNPRWFLPVMLGILVLGLAWLIVFYISGAQWPVESWGNWNLLVGFGIMVVGVGMSTRWR